MIPVYKVLSVFLRQLSKPFANYLKKRASASDRFRNLCIAFGNKSYSFDRYISRRFYNSDVSETEPITISQERSVIIGTELLGECVIFAIAATVITAEYARSVRKEFRKELKLKERLDELDRKQETILRFMKEEIDKQVNEKLSTLKR